MEADNTTTVGTRKLIVNGRRPRTNETHRICASEECDTVLNRYNVRATCYAHAPLAFPRVRGNPARP